MSILAILVLENGIIFYGKSVSIEGSTTGELVFNTSITGYQEILTDPSYYNQIIILTHPHIGNTGTNFDDEESKKIYAKGLIARNISTVSYHYTNKKNLINYLKDNKVITIAEIDTRKLTRLLRKIGTLKGCIYTENKENYYSAYQKSILFHGLKNIDLVNEVSTKKIFKYSKTSMSKKITCSISTNKLKYSSKQLHVVVYDFGIKHNILRLLKNRRCIITVVPATTTGKNALKLFPDGIFLSNGPGDPKPCAYAIKAIQFFLKKNIPIFGICLGHQLLALANHANIIKMKCGHHGANHPVKNVLTNKVLITSQNHNFTVDLKNLPSNIKITHTSLFDGTLQGLSLTNKLAFSFQGHPEGSPGPHDAQSLFDSFITMMLNNKHNQLRIF